MTFGVILGPSDVLPLAWGGNFSFLCRKEDEVLGGLRERGRFLPWGLAALGVPGLLCEGLLQGCLCAGAPGGCSGDRNEANTLKGRVVGICTSACALGYRTSPGSAEAAWRVRILELQPVSVRLLQALLGIPVGVLGLCSWFCWCLETDVCWKGFSQHNSPAGPGGFPDTALSS